MTIRHDRSASIILTKCSDCGDFWHALRETMDAARDAGERHELKVHGRDLAAVSNRRRQAAHRTRHAVNS